MQIGRSQISFYLILRMANLCSKAREKGQNYKDLGLLPLSLTSNEASHLNLRTRDAVTCSSTNAASKHEQQQLTKVVGGEFMKV